MHLNSDQEIPWLESLERFLQSKPFWLSFLSYDINLWHKKKKGGSQAQH